MQRSFFPLRLILFLLLLAVAATGLAQDSAGITMTPAPKPALYYFTLGNNTKPAAAYAAGNMLYDTAALSKQQIKKRVKIIAAANIIGYSGAMVGLYDAWYKNYPQSNFHFFNDFPEWQQIDKIGHAYSAYAESKASMELWRWTGIDRKKRIWIGGMSGAFYQTVIETLDGFSSEWGWSWGDFGANIFGSGLFVAQELAWDEQRIQYKFSFHRKKYSDPQLNQRSDKIFGTSTAERFLKDYNGQTYWLSFNIKSFFPQSKCPRWLQVAVGTGAEGMFGAVNNIATDANGTITFNRTDIKRYRQWYLAPDIDLSKIKTKKKGIRIALDILNIVKFPLPAVEYGNGKWQMNWISF
ncbi:MAG: DUF2279 domain-containing protein [Bacteroidetes bacterium]|nr:DUF2279 domain-containing protein [Bacteroidota bacterium]